MEEVRQGRGGRRAPLTLTLTLPLPLTLTLTLTLTSYEDDPMQAGVSGGPPGKNCWMVDEVSRCWDGDDDDRDGSRAGGPPPLGGRAAPLVVDSARAPMAGSVLHCVA